MPYERTHAAGHRPDQRRGAQAHETDRSGQGDGGRREERGEHDGGDAGAAHRDAEAARRVVPERKTVDAAGEQHQADERDDHEGRHADHARETVLGDAALVPLVEALGLFREEQDQRLGDGVEAEGEGAAREDQADGGGAASGEAEHDGGRGESADEGDRGGREHGDGRAGGREHAEREVRTGVDGEGVGRGEHVAAHRLQDGAGRAERHADEQSGHHARQPGGDDDGGVARLGLPGEGLPHLARADVGRAVGDVDDGEHGDEQHEPGRHPDGAEGRRRQSAGR